MVRHKNLELLAGTKLHVDCMPGDRGNMPVAQLDQRYHPKEPALGIELSGQFKAYPLSELKQSAVTLKDTLAGQPVVVKYDRLHNAVIALDAQGEQLPAVTAYWFAWYAFHPQTDVYVAEQAE